MVHSSSSRIEASQPRAVFPSNLFLLNPKSAAYLNGTGRLPFAFNFRAAILLLLLYTGIASLLFFAKGAGDWLTETQLNNTGVTVQGAIVNYQPKTSGSTSQQYLYPVRYQFALPDNGTVISNQQFVRKDVFDRFSEGALVTVKYLPADPTVAVLVGSDMTSGPDINSFVPMIVGLVGFVIAVMYLLPLVSLFRQEMRLRQSGCVIIGQVLYCRQHIPTDDDEQPKRLSRHYVVELSYRFQTPEGKSIRGLATHKRDDLKGKRLPAFTTPVAVLYLDAEHYRVL